jgi:PhoH-like ATPase
MANTKLFVLDTNVILHDSQCLYSFQEHDIAIPITVIEELDQFKKGTSDINFQARQFLRSLDELTGDLLAEDGAPLGEGRGRIRVALSQQFESKVEQAFIQDIPDHRILNTALMLSRQESNRAVILVSKDTNVRIKAKALGIVAQDFTTDKVKNFDTLYTGKRHLKLEDALLDCFFNAEGSPPAVDVPYIEAPVANENFILRSNSRSILATYKVGLDRFQKVEKLRCYGISPRNAEQSFALNALVDDSIKLVTLAGRAGTGKTLLALASALQQRRNFRQILLARPIVPLSNKDIGFLPGDVHAKLDPYMQPLYDNLTVIKGQFDENDAERKKLQQMQETEKLLITPLAYIRGRSLQKIFFIVDEAQNLTPHEVKTIITRAGEGTKIVFTGDIRQIDHPYLDSLSNGLTYLINRMKGQSIYAHVTLRSCYKKSWLDNEPAVWDSKFKSTTK